MAFPFRTPPETGLSGRPRAGGAAGASPSVFTAGPSASGTLAEVVAGAGALVVAPLSSEATRSGAAALRAGAGFGASAFEGLGCAAAVLFAGGFETGCGCVLAATVFGAAFKGALPAGALLEVAGLCVAPAGCDIFAS